MQDANNPSLGHPATFNVYVGDVDMNGQRVDQQFFYYPHANPPVLIPESSMPDASQLEEGETPGADNFITEHSTDQVHQFYWEATKYYREHHDKVARGEIPPADTPDGNPPPPEQPEQDLPPHRQNGSPNSEYPPPLEQVREQGFDQPGPAGFPTVEVDVETFSHMQRQLVIAEFQPIIDLQEIVIETQAILLRDALDPDSPHHNIVDMWMLKLEKMRAKLNAEPEPEEFIE